MSKIGNRVLATNKKFLFTNIQVLYNDGIKSGVGVPTPPVMLSLPKHPAARRIFCSLSFRYARSFDYAQDDDWVGHPHPI